MERIEEYGGVSDAGAEVDVYGSYEGKHLPSY
jgi:hypothetical protein